MTASRRIRLYLVALAAVLGYLGYRSAPWPLPEARPDEPTVLLFVLDTVRAENTSICGYERPTTPYLESLVARGAQLSCAAYSPGSWTLPAHASFFTGVPPHVHGAGIGPSEVDFGWGTARPLDERLPTMAEQFKAQGYQTALWSSNKGVSDITGLGRGFDVQVIANRFEDFWDEAMIDAVEDSLRWEIDPQRPLFAVINISDAHGPWPAHQGVEWLPDRPAVNGWSEKAAYELGQWTEQEAALQLAHVEDVYDHGIYRADRSAGRLMHTFEELGWLGDEFRVVIVSDHGMFTGEHGRLLHGGSQLHEPLSRVPLLLHASGPTPELPAPVSAIVIHDYLLHGTIEPRPVRASTMLAERVAGMDPCTMSSSAEWTPTSKSLCLDGRARQYDLAADPTELHPLDAAPPAEFIDFAQAVDEAAGSEAKGDLEVSEALRALGYLGG